MMFRKTVLGIAAAASIGASAVAQQKQSAATPPAGAGLDLINERCGSCHNTGQVFSVRQSASDWAATVQKMTDRGAELDPDEQKVVVDYLAANFASQGTRSASAADRSVSPSPSPAQPSTGHP